MSNGPGLHLFQDVSRIFMDSDQEGNNMPENHGIFALAKRATRGTCRFEHPSGRRRDLMPASGQGSSRHRSLSRDHEEVVARMDLDPDYCSRVAR